MTFRSIWVVAKAVHKVFLCYTCKAFELKPALTAIKTPVVYRQQIETWKDHKKYKSTIINILLIDLKSFLISQVVLYIKHQETDDTEEWFRRNVVTCESVQRGRGGYTSILSPKKHWKSCWRQSTCIIYVRHFLVIHWWQIHRQGWVCCPCWCRRCLGSVNVFYFIVFSVFW